MRSDLCLTKSANCVHVSLFGWFNFGVEIELWQRQMQKCMKCVRNNKS